MLNRILKIGIFTFSLVQGETFNITFEFNQSEAALNTLFRAHVFPHPIGVYGDNDYNIYLWEPSVNIESNSVIFNFTVFADITIGSETIQYIFPFSLPLEIPTGELSIQGLITQLEGIPDVINALNGPQWVKDIIITEYEDLELLLYPNSLLEAANENIPENWDININDFGITPSIDGDILTFTLFTEILSNPLTLITQYYAGYANITFQFNPNVPVVIIGYKITSQMGSYAQWDDNLNLSLAANTYAGNSFNINFSPATVPTTLTLQLGIGSGYGVWIYTYQFSVADGGWHTLGNYNTIP